VPNYCFDVVEPWRHELKVLNPELAEILESGGIDIGKKLEPAAFFFSFNLRDSFRSLCSVFLIIAVRQIVC
jgi:hypothetical protein